MKIEPLLTESNYLCTTINHGIEKVAKNYKYSFLPSEDHHRQNNARETHPPVYCVVPFLCEYPYILVKRNNMQQCLPWLKGSFFFVRLRGEKRVEKIFVNKPRNINPQRTLQVVAIVAPMATVDAQLA